MPENYYTEYDLSKIIYSSKNEINQQLSEV